MCECKVGPGKFEGESVLTFLAYECGFPDETTGSGEFGNRIDWYRGPFTDFSSITCPEAAEAARAYGYCEAGIAEALEDDSYGLSIWESEQGFVYGTTYATKAEFDSAMAEAEAEDEAMTESENGNDPS